MTSRQRVFPGRSFETGALCNALYSRGVTVPHTGQPYSEALLLGVSGGISFAYMTFQYKGWPSHLALLTRNTFDPLQTAIKRLGILEETKETTDPKRAFINVVEALENGTPVVVWADVFSLPYTGLSPQPTIWSMMPVLVHAFDDHLFHIADRSKVSIQISAEDLGAARGRVKKDRFRMATFGSPDPKKLPDAVRAGIRQCIDLYSGHGAPRGHADNFGFSGFQKWAEMLENTRNKQSWARVFPTGADLFRAIAGKTSQPGVFVWIMTRGASADAERGLFADFLDEAALILSERRLGHVANQFREIAGLWRKLAESTMPDSIPVLRETRDLLLRQRELFIEQGRAADQERSAIRALLEKSAPIAAEALDPASESVRSLKKELREYVLKIHDAERAAIEALARIFNEPKGD